MCTQIAMGAFVSYFFSGFILGKIPFPLSPSFRLMLQVPPKAAPCHAHSSPLLALACSFLPGVRSCILCMGRVPAWQLACILDLTSDACV